MRKLSAITITILLLIGFLSAFVVLDKFDNDKFSLILNIINSTQIILTLFVAYLVYDRFGTSRKLLDKQNDIVIEYIEHLKKIRINIYEWTGEHVYTAKEIGISRNLTWYYNDKDRPVLFKRSFYDFSNVNRLRELINHPLFPPEIKSKVNIFSFPVMTATFSDYKQAYTFVSFENERTFEMAEWMLAGESHEECLTINQLIKQIEDILKTLEDWVNKESSIKIKLNF